MPLWPSSAVFSTLGAILGLWGVRRGFSLGDRAAVCVSSAISALMGSAVMVAVARTLEAPLPGTGLVHAGLVMGAWIGIGVALAWGSMWLVPGPDREGCVK